MKILIRTLFLLCLTLAVRGFTADDAKDAVKGEWQLLFANEDWYKQQDGKEQEFTGKLEAVPPLDGATMLMRDAFYKLGNRTIHTAGQKHPTLDKLVGKQVIIRGKAVDMELEGTNLHELWPVAIRLAPPAEKPKDSK